MASGENHNLEQLDSISSPATIVMAIKTGISDRITRYPLW